MVTPVKPIGCQANKAVLSVEAACQTLAGPHRAERSRARPCLRWREKVAELTEDDVLQILNLIENSSFDFLQLQVGDLKLTVSKTGYGGSIADTPTPAVSVRPAAEVKETETKGDQPEPRPRDAAGREGVVPIAAPMVGTFYTTTEPGAPPYVEAGAQVEEDTTVGLIEVMKVFTAVKSGVCGSIAEILVQNGQFVEYGQTLFLVSPKLLNKEEPSG